LIEDEGAAARDHGAPFGQGRLGAEADKAQPGSSEDDTGHVEGDADDHGRGAERQYVLHDDTDGPAASQLHGGNVLGVADGEGFGAGDAGVGGPGRDGDGDDGIVDAGAEGGHEGQRQDQLGERQEDIGEAHEDAVDPTAEIAGNRADQQAQRRRDQGHQQHDGEGNLRPPDDAGEDVAAQLVRAHPVRGGRRQEAGRKVLSGRRIGGNPRRKGRGEQQHDHPAQDREGVSEEGGEYPIGAAGVGLPARGGTIGQKPVAGAHQRALGSRTR
jgi:hypothetical protein